jgi:hypothetical protein
MTSDLDFVELEARGARNQALFRNINEGVRHINAAFSTLVPLGTWTCECANLDCFERVELTSDQYEEVRAAPTRFAVAPDDRHVLAEIERVVARKDRFWVVEKEGRAAELVATVDPRADDS